MTQPRNGRTTPGPWIIGGFTEVVDGKLIAVQERGAFEVAFVPVWKEADAHLITAAPDLLEVAEVMCRTYHFDVTECPCRQAIAKAKGTDKAESPSEGST